MADLYRRANLARPIDDLERIGRMLRGADLIVSAWDGDKLVGIARALTDFSYSCYLSDLAVDEAYQGKGTGKALTQQLREHLGDEVTIVVLAAPGAAEYYPRLGFEKVENAWRIPRKR